MRHSYNTLVSTGTMLIACCYGFARFAYGLFTPTLIDEFALTPALVGAIGSGSYIGYCIAIVVSTVLTRRKGARYTAVTAGVVATCGLSVVATAPSTFVLFVGVVVAGSSTGLASPPLAAAVNRWVDSGRRDRTQTVVNAGTGVGVILSAPIALLLFGHWRLAWAVMAVISAAVTMLVFRAIPPSADSTERAAPRPGWRPGALGLVAASVLVGIGSVAVWTFGREMTAGLGSTLSVLAWAVLGAAGIAGAFSGDVARRVGLTVAWRIALTMMVGATLAYAAFATNGIAVVAAAATFGSAYIALTGLVLLWAVRVYPDSTAFGVGMAFLAIAVGQALGAPAVGFFAGATSDAAAFVISAAVGAVALAVAPARESSG